MLLSGGVVVAHVFSLFRFARACVCPERPVSVTWLVPRAPVGDAADALPNVAPHYFVFAPRPHRRAADGRNTAGASRVGTERRPSKRAATSERHTCGGREWTRSVRYVDRLAGASCSYNIHKPRNERSSLALGLATRLAAHDWGLSRSVHTDNHTYPVSLHPPSGEATSVWVGSATYWNGWQEVLWQSRVQMNGSPSLQVHLEAMHAHSSPAWQTLDAFVELQKSVSSGGQLHPSHAPLSSRPGAAKVE